jgi:hypothetical protein
VPPQGVSGRPVPAQIEVRVLASGELLIDPVGVVLKSTAFPVPGGRGGPSMAVTVRNISPLPLKLSLRLSGIAPALDSAATVRGSAAGAVLVNTTLGAAATWTAPTGLLASGDLTTLRLRFKLKPGIDADAFNGKLDIRQLELKGVPDLTAAPATTPPTTPATTPGGTPPASAPGETSPASTPATTPSDGA